MLISVIVPCFNEEAVIVETYRQLTDVMKKLPHDYELLFVNDGSADNTLQILTDLSKTDKMVKILSFLAILVINVR
ncbi:hypothetical protein AGMMS4957_00940 [Bacteroidia bacterium]|nr:hypothetical protein AGMMS4957_00940 [Bacteroidia bacterium]